MSPRARPVPADQATIAKAVELALDQFKFFCRQCVKIKNKDGLIVPLILNNAQETVVAEIIRQELAGGPVMIAVLKARQMGISTVLEVYIFWRGLRKGNVGALGLAHEKQDAAPHIFAITRFAAKNLPEWFKTATGVDVDIDTKMRLTFTNGFEFSVTSAESKSPGRSLTIQYAHLSEAAFYPDGQKLTAPLFAAMPKTPEAVVLVESTGNGPQGWFFDLFNAALAGNNDYAAIFLPWYIHEEYRRRVPKGYRPYCPPELEQLRRQGVVDDEQLYWREKVIQNDYQGDEMLFRVEYPATIEQAWQQDAEHVFASQAIQARLNEAQNAAGETGSVIAVHIEEDDFTRSRSEFSPGPAGPLTVYKFPEPGRLCVIGADVGSGAAAKDGDPSCADVLDAGTGEQIAHLHLVAEPQIFALHLYALGVFYNLAMIAVETTGGHGLAVVNWLRDAGYYNLFRRRVMDRVNGGYATVLGWNTSKKTKEFLIDMLRADFTSGAIVVNHLPTLREMSTYIYAKSKLSGIRRMMAQGQAKDDRVISLAVGNAARRDALGILDAPGEEGNEQPVAPQAEPEAQAVNSERMAFRQRMMANRAANDSDYF